MGKKCGQVNTWQEKKDKFQRKRKPAKNILRLTGGALALIIIATVLYGIFNGRTEGEANQGKTLTNSASGQDVRIPLSEVNDGLGG